MIRAIFLIFIIISFSNVSLACESKYLLNSCRDSGATLLKKGKLKRSFKKYHNIKSELEEILVSDLSKTTEKVFLYKLLNIKTIKDQVNDCVKFLGHEFDNALKLCREEILEDVIYYLRSNNFVDDTAAIIILQKLMGK